VKPAQIAFGDLRLAFSFSIQYNTWFPPAILLFQPV
jgi:hypothetical protein